MARTRTRRHVYAAVYVSCTRPCARPVQGRVHIPCTGPCTRHVHGRRRPYRRPVHSHVDGWCRRVHGPYTAVYGPCIRHGRYTAVYGPFSRAKACSRPCTRPPCNRHTTRYTAVYTTRYTAVYTDRTRPHNGRLHGRVTAV